MIKKALTDCLLQETQGKLFTCKKACKKPYFSFNSVVHARPEKNTVFIITSEEVFYCVCMKRITYGIRLSHIFEIPSISHGKPSNSIEVPSILIEIPSISTENLGFRS